MRTATSCRTRIQSSVNQMLQISFKTVAKVLEHGGSTGQHDIL